MWLLSTEKKKKKAKPRRRELYFIWVITVNLWKGSLLESSERLFQRGKGGVRI